MATLDRITHANGVVTYRSPLLHDRRIPHAFTTRLGGASVAPFDSLHLGTTQGGEHFDENFRRVLHALDVADHRPVYVSQVHGCDVHVPNGESCHSVSADALVTADAGKLLSVRVADCVPILLAASDGSVVAAVHAGWRGVVQNVLLHTLQRMQRDFDVAADSVLAAIGPCISVRHFEVGPEVADAFQAAALSEAIDTTRGPKPHIDLTRAVRRQLLSAGLSPDAIDTTDRCTFRDQADFFSHRRDNGLTGRMAAVIATKPSHKPHAAAAAIDARDASPLPQ